MAYDTILFSVDGGIARLTLNRPDKLNSFNTQMHGEVRDALSGLSARGARVLVLTGAGRGFCAGQDLGDRAVAPGSQNVDLGESIEKHYKPLVLALAHPAHAGDRSGQRGGGGGRRQHRAGLRYRHCRALRQLRPGVRQARTASRFGRDLDAAAPGRTGACARLDLARQQAVRGDCGGWGMIWQCVEDADLQSTVEALATQFAAAPTRGLAATKAAIRGSGEHSLAGQLDIERDAQRELGRSADYAEGVAAFIGKRPPNFTGR